MKPTPLEIAESVDMMRILENGYSVYMAKTKYKTQSVDTIQDLKKVEKLIKNKKMNTPKNVHSVNQSIQKHKVVSRTVYGDNKKKELFTTVVIVT